MKLTKDYGFDVKSMFLLLIYFFLILIFSPSFVSFFGLLVWSFCCLGRPSETKAPLKRHHQTAPSLIAGRPAAEHSNKKTTPAGRPFFFPLKCVSSFFYLYGVFFYSSRGTSLCPFTP